MRGNAFLAAPTIRVALSSFWPDVLSSIFVMPHVCCAVALAGTKKSCPGKQKAVWPEFQTRGVDGSF